MYNLINKMLYLLMLLVAIAVSCDSGKKKEIIKNDDIYTVDFDNTPKEEKIFMSSLFKKVKPIPLETTDESLIGYINEAQVFDGKIFVLDTNYAKGLFVFDMEGKFIRQIGRVGQGPEEYVDLSDFTIDETNREIYLMDRSKNRIMIYDINTGKYIRRINISEQKMTHYIQYSNGRLYTDANYKSKSEENYLLHEIDIQSGKYKNSWLPAECNKGWMGSWSYNNFFFSRDHQKSPKYVQLLMDTVYSIEKEGVSPFLTVRSSQWTTKNDVKKANDDVMKIDGATYNRVFCLNNLIEGKDVILFTLYENSFNNQYHVLCDNRNGGKNVRIAGRLVNDILFEGERFGIWRLCCSDEKGVYSILPIEHLSFTENLDEVLKKDAPNREALLNAKDDDNPVILYFEYE
jgi:hypothetical protein